MFTLKESAIQGCFELQPKVLDDNRGKFVKVFHESEFVALELETVFVEEYYSVSDKNVIRGMHFQLPPNDHVKMVYCVDGEVMDVVVDLRLGSPTYGQHAVFQLGANKANIIYIPKGMAHGFCVMSDKAILVYKVSSVYSLKNDMGIHWDSINIPWPTKTPIISNRDQGLLALNKFVSPFVYE